MMFQIGGAQVEARRLKSSTIAEIAAWCGGFPCGTYGQHKPVFAVGVRFPSDVSEQEANVRAEAGVFPDVSSTDRTRIAWVGEWIILGESGVFTSCPHAQFIHTHKPVGELPAVSPEPPSFVNPFTVRPKVVAVS